VSELVLIDLGLIGREPTAEDAARGWLFAHRAWVAAAVAVVLFSVLGASAAPTPPPYQGGIRIDAVGSFRIAGERLYVLSSGAATGLVAYDLRTLAAVWHAPPGLRGFERAVAPAAAAVLVTAERPDGLQTAALDPGTGRLLWQRPGRVDWATTATGLVLFSEWPALADPPPGGVRVLRAVDVRTGRSVWSAGLPAEAVVSVPGPEPRLAVIGLPSGRVETLDLRDGEVLASRQVVRDPAAGNWLRATEQLALVADGPGRSTAYTLPGLVARWSVPLDLSARTVHACGRQLCVAPADGGLRVIDPGTGATRWTSYRWRDAIAVGDRLLAFRPGGGVGTAAVVDAATGAVRFELGTWRPMQVSWSNQGRIAVVRTGRGDARTWFGLLDVDLPGVVVFGFANGVRDTCQFVTEVVVCRLTDGSIGVWRYQ
jgi:hypothetical protein